MSIRTTTTLAVLLAALGAGGCQGVKEQLGVGRHSPDEFTVVKRAPLTLPPDYSLRAPATGSAPPAAVASNQAKTILLGEAETGAETTGSADEQMLARLGANRADPAIRDKISEENGYIALENQKVIDKLMFWEDTEPDGDDLPASQVDAAKEAERLKANKQAGQSVTDGETPVVEEKRGAIDKLF